MTTIISLTTNHFQTLDLSPAQTVIEGWLQDGAIANHEQQLGFKINFDGGPEDPREFSEIPEF